ncbi:MAG: hypothetical protein KatS3mg076_1335 [Candidatus Binatia bacterium]|nr:MAG: hypothetical protein KatS3mg076_1335 [Candidatus Binatia bacterium]
MGTPYGEQLEKKRSSLVAALAAHGLGGLVEVPEVKGSPEVFGYRTQAKLVVRRMRGRLVFGLYRPGSHRVEEASACAVHHPLVGRVLDALRLEVERRKWPVYDERTGEGLLRFVVVRVSRWQKKAQLVLVTRAPLPGVRDAARKLLEKVRGLASVVENLNPTPGNVIWGERSVPRGGEPGLLEKVGHLKLVAHPGAFLQANIPVARRIYRRVVELACPGPGDVVLDLYSGVGAIALHLAERAKLVLAVEESPVAVADAKANARRNGFHNVRFFCGQAALRVEELLGTYPGFDVVAVNPPRAGMDERAREAVLRACPARLVYVSCEPTTLARDLRWFVDRGFRLARVEPFDMLPQTEHVETVALLERGERGLQG